MLKQTAWEQLVFPRINPQPDTATPGIIMIVDDLPDNLRLLEIVLKGKGFQVFQARSGSEALALLNLVLPDVIFLDLMMPDMDGLEVTRRIRAMTELPYIPIVLLTASQDNKAKITGLDAGADEFLAKPFSQPELIARARSLIRLRRYNQALAQAVQDNRYLNDLLLTENTRMAEELERTRQAQMRLMPQAGPDYPGVSFAVYYQPALEVGGDYYDYVRLDEERFVVVLGDAVGKGGAAVLAVAVIKSVLATEFAHALQEKSTFEPAQVLERINGVICGPMESSQTEMTLFCGLVDLGRRTIRYSNAGQTFPLLARTGSVQELKLGGLPIGLFSDATYSTQEICFEQGDRLMLYSDGLNEATDLQHEQFGFDRLRAAVLAHAGLSPQPMLEGIMEQVHLFCQDADDDQTLVIFGF